MPTHTLHLISPDRTQEPSCETFATLNLNKLVLLHPTNYLCILPYPSDNCLSSRKLGGPLREIVTVSVHKYDLKMSPCNMIYHDII